MKYADRDEELSQQWVRSKVTEPDPGLTKGKLYRVRDRGFYQGFWVSIVNDRGGIIAINDALTYLEQIKVSEEPESEQRL